MTNQAQTVLAPWPNIMSQDQTVPNAIHNMTMMRQKMQANQKMAADRLQRLVDKMNAAKGEAKVDAIADVVTELAWQRTFDRQAMNRMSQMMMPWVASDMNNMPEECPMLKEFGQTPRKEPRDRPEE
jgi:hypothetical protein